MNMLRTNTPDFNATPLRPLRFRSSTCDCHLDGAGRLRYAVQTFSPTTSSSSSGSTSFRPKIALRSAIDPPDFDCSVPANDASTNAVLCFSEDTIVGQDERPSMSVRNQNLRILRMRFSKQGSGNAPDFSCELYTYVVSLPIVSRMTKRVTNTGLF